MGEKQIFNTRWPNYGFDEWFLLTAIFPRLVDHGFGIYGGAGHANVLFPMDIANQVRKRFQVDHQRKPGQDWSYEAYTVDAQTYLPRRSTSTHLECRDLGAEDRRQAVSVCK